MRAIVVLALAAVLAACQPVANMPVELRDEIEAASRSLEEQWDTPPPAVFSFRDVHCRADGHLLIVFEQRGSLAGGTIATATSSGIAYRPWTPNWGVEDLPGEVSMFFAKSQEVACPLGPAG